MPHSTVAAPDLIDAITSFASQVLDRDDTEGRRPPFELRGLFAHGQRVYIAHIAGTPYTDLIALAGRLRKEGFEPVIHLTARDMPNSIRRSIDVLARYTGEAGARKFF